MVVLTSDCPSSSCTVHGSTENPGAGNTYGQAKGTREAAEIF